MLNEVKRISLPKIEDDKGNLSFIEGKFHVPFTIKRVYWINDVPGGASRGGHAFKTAQEFIVALSGSFNVVLDDGFHKKTFNLSRSHYGLYIPNMIWHTLKNFSTNSLCLILASEFYDKHDSINDYYEYKEIVVNETR